MRWKGAGSPLGKRNQSAPDKVEHHGQFIQLPKRVLESDAYRHCSPLERSVLIEITLRFNGHNNGRIGCDVRHLADRHSRKNLSRYSRAIAGLIEKGLLDIGDRGSYEERKAREYRLTWASTHTADMRKIPATNEWAKWRPEKQKRVTETVTGKRDSVTETVTDGSKGCHETRNSVDGNPPFLASEPVTVSVAHIVSHTSADNLRSLIEQRIRNGERGAAGRTAAEIGISVSLMSRYRKGTKGLGERPRQALAKLLGNCTRMAELGLGDLDDQRDAA